MSCSPKAFATNEPTGAVLTNPSRQFAAVQLLYRWCAVKAATLACEHSALSSSPKGNFVSLVARAAYSHSASVSSRYVAPVLSNSQGRYWPVMSSHEMLMTGRAPRPQPSSSGLSLQPPALTHASHSANVTSYFAIANGELMVTLRCGPSFSSRLFSFTGEPIMKKPVGTTTISGHSGQSLKVSLGFKHFSLVAGRRSGVQATLEGRTDPETF